MPRAGEAEPAGQPGLYSSQLGRQQPCESPLRGWGPHFHAQMGEREKRLLLFLRNSTGATARRNQGCKPHREAAPPPLIFIWYLSVLGKGSKGRAERTLNLSGISSIPSACRRPANSSALFPAQWEQPSTPCSLLGNMLSGHQGFLQSHHPLQLPLLPHKMAALSREQACPSTQEQAPSRRQGYCGRLCPGEVTNHTQPSQDTALQLWGIRGEGSPTASLQSCKSCSYTRGGTCVQGS